MTFVPRTISALRAIFLPVGLAKVILWLGIGLLLSVPAMAQAPVVSNVVAQQRSGTKLVDITYDVTAGTPTVKVTLDISSDGGATWAVPVTSASGAIGEGVAVESGKSIIWNAGVDWDAKSSSQMRFRLIADNQIINGLSLIPAGAFTMGRTSGDTDSDAPSVTVNISRFYMSKHLVTKALWDEVRIWATANGYTDLSTGAGKAADHPVQTVNWWDVIKWCNARSQKEGLTPCYTVSGSVMKTGTTEPTVDWSANGYRLPTEAEWEKAARGGVSGKRFPWGTDTISHNEANFSNNGTESYKAGSTGNHPTYANGSLPYTSKVGSFAANAYDLYDMAGNVWEWCWDWYGTSNYVEGATNPTGKISGDTRVLRGGSWGSEGVYNRAAYRSSFSPSNMNNVVGFRVASTSGIVARASSASTETNLDTRMWTLTTSTVVNGSVSGAGSYLSQTNANLTATPSSGYLFGSWSAAASGSNNPTTVLMDSNKTVGATFVEDTRDPDNDGLTNYQEIIIRLTNPNLADTDNDGVNDGQEVADTSDPLVADTDGDGLNDGEEKTRTTNPLITDTDGDGLSDYQEIIIRLTNPNLADSDNDGVNDGQEVTDTTNPLVADSDGDGLNDGEEKTRSTNPLLTDTDDDGYSDSYEVNNDADPNTKTSFPTYTLTLANNGTVTGGAFAKSGTLAHGTDATVTATPLSGYLFGSWNGAASGSNNPTTVLMDSNKTVGATFVEDTRDPDNDGLTNYQEIIIRLTNPNLADTDNDGVNDGQEVADTSDPLVADTDGDGLNDGEEKTRTTNPLITDTDGDGLSDYQEIIIRLTNPNLADSDNDGVNDGQEVTDTTNPLVADSDGDGLNDGEEKTRSTNPLLTDTDDDGYSDSYEVNNDADPNTKTSFPTYTLTLANNGTVTGGAFAKSGTLAHGTDATVTATPLSGYLFGSWNGAASGSNNPTTVLMDSNKTVGATFVEDTRDPDNDGLTSYQEIIIRLTNPNLADSDNDGVNDGQEVNDTTNPLVADSDSDGLNDGNEKTRGTNPLAADTDGDTYWDSYEVQFSSDPKSASSFPTYTLTLSNNGTTTGGTFAKTGTLAHGTNATVTATPLSGYLFGSWSGAASGSNNPNTVLMNSNKTVGATFVEDSRDPDSDGLTNYQEIIVRLTNPNVSDSDSDGVNDGQEVADSSNPLIADTDGDELNDGQEKTLGTNPLVTDTDGDSYSDSYEVNNDADPKANTSFPTYSLSLTNNGTALGGTFAKSGTLAHGTNATLTATPLPGYLFGSWNSDASGSENPATILMDANKTVGATFVQDTRDPDSDGLTNYQEIIVRLTNPNVADSDNDGVNDGQEVTDATNPLVADTDGDGITDGEEKTRTTNPLLVDTDGDGLGDLQEITITQTNPLLSDTNGNGINDALEDTDNDGILNGREVNQLSTNPLLADSNANGLSDTYELLFQGNTDPFTPRVGDRVRYDLSQLGYQGTYKIVGTLPKGLTFNATTGILEGKLIGTASTSKLTIQILNGKTVLRSIPLNIPVLAFPATLAGTWQALLENQQGQPEGLLTVTITSPGTWSASYDGIGTRTIRKATGTFDLVATQEQSAWNMTFPAIINYSSNTPAVTMSFGVDGITAIASGTHSRGTMRGFRLARGTELPTATKTITMLIDQGVQDGFVIPAGMGWATGSISNRGAVALKGQLGDAQAITTTLSLGATGQALMWLKPYKNLNSYIGGIVSLHGSGVLPASPLHNQESGLWWYRAADATEIGYSIGFAPMSASVGVRSHLVPASALALSQNLGLTEQVIRGVVFDGGGLPDPNATAKLPEAFGIDASYKMIAAPLPGQLMSPWTGLIASRTGGFTGTLGMVANNQGTLAGNAAVSGVLFPTVGSRVVGAGLVKIPIVGPKGAFRTGAILLGTEEQN